LEQSLLYLLLWFVGRDQSHNPVLARMTLITCAQSSGC